MPQDKDRTDVHIKVDQSTKDDWQKHVEDSEDLSSLSSLIRRATNKEVSGEFEADEDQYDEVIDELASLADAFDSLSAGQQTLIQNMPDIAEIEDSHQEIIERMEQLHTRSDE